MTLLKRTGGAFGRMSLHLGSGAVFSWLDWVHKGGVLVKARDTAWLTPGDARLKHVALTWSIWGR